MEDAVRKVADLAKASGINLKTEDFALSLKTAINGDTQIIEFLPLQASLSKDKDGLLVYVLTKSKVIKFEIDNEGFRAFSFYLSQFVGVNRSVINKPDGGNNSHVAVEFTQGGFGLRYPLGNKEIDSFFLRMEDQARQVKSA